MVCAECGVLCLQMPRFRFGGRLGASSEQQRALRLWEAAVEDYAPPARLLQAGDSLFKLPPVAESQPSGDSTAHRPHESQLLREQNKE